MSITKSRSKLNTYSREVVSDIIKILLSCIFIFSDVDKMTYHATRGTRHGEKLSPVKVI